MDIETLAMILRSSQTQNPENISLSWLDLDESTHEYYRQQARYVQEHAISPLEEKIKKISKTILFSTGNEL